MNLTRCIANFLNLALLCVGLFLAGERSAYAQTSNTHSDNENIQSRPFARTTDCPEDFNDNFEDGVADGWSPRNASRWNVTIDGGSRRYFLNTTNYHADSGERLGEYSIITGKNFDDFTFECKAKSWDAAVGNENPDLAVVFGYQNDDNYYYVVFNGAPGLTSIVLIQNRTPRTLATYSGSTFLDGQYHTIGVERRGDEILVSFDGTQIMSARDATFRSGGIGVGSYNDSGYFDDVSVTGSACTPGTVEITFEQIISNTNATGFPQLSSDESPASSWIFTIDGNLYNAPITFHWEPGTQHTVEANPHIPESPCLTRELFQRWDDGGSRSRVIVVPNTNRTYSAIYRKEARFRLRQTTGGRATQSMTVSSDDYYPFGSTMACEAFPDPGYVFKRWDALHRGNMETGPTFYSSANPVEVNLGCWIDLYPVFGRDTTITIIRSGTPASPSIYDISSAGAGAATMKVFNDERWLTVEYAFLDKSSIAPFEAVSYGINALGDGLCESTYLKSSTYLGEGSWTAANCCHPVNCTSDMPDCFDSNNHGTSSSTSSGHLVIQSRFLIDSTHPDRMQPPKQIFFSGTVGGTSFNFPPSSNLNDCNTWPSFELWAPPCDSAQQFTDDFEDGVADGWTPRNASRWNVTNDAGSQRYFLNTTNYNADTGERLGEYAIISSKNFDDFTFECQAKSWDAAVGNENPDLAVVFGYQNDDNYYYAVFNGAPSLTSIVLIQNRTPRTLATYSGSTFLDGQYHTIGIERRGDEISVSFDGTQIMSARDATFRSGGVGVGSYNDSGYFDDIVVRGSCAPDTLPTIALPANLSGAPGDTLQIPVEVSTSENIGIAQFTIDYNGDVLAFLNASIGPDAPGFSVSQVNSNPLFPPATPGTNRNLLVQISGGSTGSFTGENRRVVMLRFRITGTSGSNSPLGFDRECTRTFLSTTDFRDLCGSALTTSNGSVVVSDLAIVSGQVQFYNGNRPVANAVLTLRGATTRSQSSDAAGRYRFDNVNPGNYTLDASKSGDLRGAITGSDVVATLQIVAFVLNPTPGQRIAGDVDRSGSVSGADAVALLRYLAFLPSGTANVGQWRFQPASPSLTVTTDVTQDFTAYLLGDVTGNWNASSMVLAAAAQRFDVAFDDARVTGDSLRLGLRVPGDAGTLHSLQASIVWQGTMGATHFQTARPDIINVVNNSEAGTTHLALATATGVASGELIGELVVPVASSQARTAGMAAAGEVTALVVNDVALHGTELRLAGGGTVPDDFVLLQNYPNPFNIHTSIRFGVPAHGAEDEVVLEIFTLQGQRIRELQREPMSPGYHTVVWDGRDDHGRLVGSGVYLFRLRAGAFRQSSKLLLLK